jgi:CxxC motif-containing protein (DUF1111 family)
MLSRATRPTSRLPMTMRRQLPRHLLAGVLSLLLLAIGGGGAASAAAPSPVQIKQAADTGTTSSAPSSLVDEGAALFQTSFTPEQGLGPLYNAQSCVACHSTPAVGGMGDGGLGVALRVGQTSAGSFDALADRGGPVARAHSVAELGYACSAHTGIPAAANLTSVRNAPPLFGFGLIDAIPDDVIRAGAIQTADGVNGRPSLTQDAAGQERVGRFGWKADTASLREFVAGAFRNELGITSPLAPLDLAPAPGADLTGCSGAGPGLEDDGSRVDAVTAFIASLEPLHGHPTDGASAGEGIFQAIGCAACHTPSLSTGERDIPLYSDLLLHDLGPVLDDGVTQGSATGRDWRTTPLWGLSLRTRFLHDGRARTPEAAIAAHGGEADAAARRFRALSPEERTLLLAFLGSL